MDRKTVLAISVLALMLGSGTAGLVVVKPALEKRDQLRAEQARLSSERANLRGEVQSLADQLNGMAMSSISYFDLSLVSDPPRTLESKTVETLKSLTEIFNDHHIKVQSLEPKGETTGANKPVPSPSPSVAPAGLAGTIANIPGMGGTPTPPPPDPNAVPTPPLITLVHKVFQLEVEGEYPDLVKALNEIQGLPKAISINEYKIHLVGEGGTEPGGAAPPSPVPGASASLLGLDFQMSVTFLMSRPLGAAPPAPAPDPAASPAKTGSAGPLLAPAWQRLLATVDTWLCPPALAKATLVATAPKPSPAAIRPWRQLWGGPSPRSKPLPRASAPALPLVLAPAGRPLPRAAVAPARRPSEVAHRPSVAPRPVAVRPHTAPAGARRQASASASRVQARRPNPAALRLAAQAPSLAGFQVVGRQGDVLTLSVDPRVVRALPTPSLADGLLGVRAEAGSGGQRLVHLELVHGQKVRATVQAGRLVVEPLGAPVGTVTAGRPASLPASVDAAAEWAKAFASPSPPAPVATPKALSPDPWQATTDEGRRLLEHRVPSPVHEGARPMMWAAASQATALRVVQAAAPQPAAVAAGPGSLRSVELSDGQLRLRTQGPRPRVWVVERRAGRLLMAVEGISGSPKGLSHVVGAGGVRAVTVMGPGPRPNTRLVSVAHDPQLRLELHPGEAGGLRLTLHGQVQAPALADMTPAAGAALLPDHLPSAAGAVRPKPKPSAKPPAPRPTPRPVARPRPARPPVPKPSPSLPARVPAGMNLVPGASPGPMATPMPLVTTRHLTPPPASSYRFPIERDRSTGRLNPFRSLPNPMATPMPGDNSALPVLPAIPGAPAAPGALPVLPGAPTAPGGVSAPGGGASFTYHLSAVLVGGGSPPLAVIMVGEQAFQVRLNELLPGNARVKLIQPDYVVLGVGGQDLRLSLRK